tara:strand:+ start:1425 stop:2471 length:1047 start_codon:yes stop_codon:yes gene_type:complete
MNNNIFIAALTVTAIGSSAFAQSDSPDLMDLREAILNDAQTRTSFTDTDSPFKLDVGGFVQTRFTYNSGGDVEANHGFGIPAARLIFSGSVYDVNYEVSGQWSDTGEFELKDAFATADVGGGVEFKFGQFKSPFMKEWLVDRQDTLGVDRSVVAYTFGQGRSQGIEIGKDFGAFNFRAAYTDGFNSANGAGVQNGYALTARAGLDISESWDVGAAVSWNDLVDTDYWTFTFDTGVQVGNLKTTLAFVGADRGQAHDWATTASIAYQCTDNLQGFLTYEYGEIDGSVDPLSIASLGANYFINSNVKWTTEVGYSLNGIGGGWDLADTGWNTSSADGGEYLFRTQIQISF